MITYFHGFGSKGGGPKGQALKERFAGRDTVIDNTLPIAPKDVVGEVFDRFHQTTLVPPGGPRPEIYVGSSLGGFYALYCAIKIGGIAVLVNPSTRPGESLRQYVGRVDDYYGGHFIWTDEHCDQLLEMETTLKTEFIPSEGNSIHLFLTEDDEVIPYQQTLADIPYRAWTQIFKDGGHRQVEHFDEVVDYIDTTFYGVNGPKYLIEPFYLDNE